MNGVAANPTGNVYSTEVERGTGGANLHGATNCVPTSCVGGGGKTCINYELPSKGLFGHMRFWVTGLHT